MPRTRTSRQAYGTNKNQQTSICICLSAGCYKCNLTSVNYLVLVCGIYFPCFGSSVWHIPVCWFLFVTSTFLLVLVCGLYLSASSCVWHILVCWFLFVAYTCLLVLVCGIRLSSGSCLWYMLVCWFLFLTYACRVVLVLGMSTTKTSKPCCQVWLRCALPNVHWVTGKC